MLVLRLAYSEELDFIEELQGLRKLLKKKNINILTLSEQIVENNFINGLESLSHYISENVMN